MTPDTESDETRPAAAPGKGPSETDETHPLPPPTVPLAPAAGGPPSRRGLRLGTRIFLVAALLVVGSLGLALSVASWRANAAAEASIREGLKAIPGIFRSYQGGLAESLRGAVASVADESGTRQLFALPETPETPPTILDWADDKAAKLGARTVFLFDASGVLIGRSDTLVTEENRRSFAGVKWVAGALRMSPSSSVIREGKSLALAVAVPVVAGDASKGEGRLLGVVAAAVPFDESRAEAVKGITNGQVAFVVDTARRGELPELEISAATKGVDGGALLSALDLDAAARKALLSGGRDIGPLDVDAGGERRIAAAVPLRSGSGETLGALVVSRSRDEETAAFRRIRNTLLLIGVAAVLVALPVSFLVARRIARPIAQLARGAEEIRAGNLDVKLPEGGSDEVGGLARAFSAMVGELKEKAALEAMIAGLPQRRTGDRPASDETRAAAPPEPSRPGAGPRVGQLFANRYVVLSILGKGGMGRVYRALDRELDDEIALKVLAPDAFGEGSFTVPALRQEIRLARKITHPNVVRTHDLGEFGGLRFLTMEYVPGTTLREVIDRRGAISLGPGLQIAKQLCRGLAAVHEAGILHRDVKPPNIMVLPNGVVKLMDFGIARPSEGIDPASEVGQTVGTPYYMSPEQARGLALDERSDVYAVGVVLYELFTGKRPIEGRDPAEVMRAHASASPVPPGSLRPDLPELLDRIVMSCLAKSPERRPPSANDLHGALLRVGG
jgi:eukaryotic-like serine/threonine-protein kinase